MSESMNVERIDDGPVVIDQGDRCEHCGSELAVGVKVSLVTLGPERIEQWCGQCVKEVR